MDEKTLQELIELLYSKKNDLEIKLISTSTDLEANRRIGQIDMTMWFINVLEEQIEKIKEEP